MMPTRPPGICAAPGCGRLARRGRCETHRRAYERERDEGRESSSARGYGRRWQRVRSAHLARAPLCAECLRSGRRTPATEVDHVIPHRGDTALMWDAANMQSLCKPCHSRKTARGA